MAGLGVTQTRGRGALLVIFMLIYRLFLAFFAYRLRNCLFSRTDGVKWESFFNSSQSKTLLFCYFVHQPGFPLVAFPPSLAKTKLQPYSFAS